MIDYSSLFTDIENTELEAWVETLPEALVQWMDKSKHGHLQEWFGLLEQLPVLRDSIFTLNESVVSVGSGDDLDESMQSQLLKSLQQLRPWRKGPFSIFGIDVDCEWRSDWKWDRLKSAISPLDDRLVLDVGCGSGYHCFRMAGAGAKLVIGLEPLWRYNIQFHVLKKYMSRLPIHLLPLTLEGVPKRLPAFDTVFSMGVLYHRKSPFEHLAELKQCLRPGGELVLETLVVEGDENTVLVPEDRYARMRNVWFLPSVVVLEKWLRRVGFDNIKLIDLNATTIEEQRPTEWMEFESLSECLDKNDSSLTVEGYPAPLRVIITARLI